MTRAIRNHAKWNDPDAGSEDREDGVDGMTGQIRIWLHDRGFPTCDIAPMQHGMGSTNVWKVSQPRSDEELVLRMFGFGTHIPAKREALAMKTAGRYGSPVPAIVDEGDIDGRAVLLMTYAPGKTAAALLAESPARAFEIGHALGSALGKLHRIQAPSELLSSSSPSRWIELGGTALKPLYMQLAKIQPADRLLHLDFHPNNVLMVDATVSAIIDWENAIAGPPHMDVARSRAILHVLKTADTLPASTLAALDSLEQGLVDGHTAVFGADPYPDLSAAWGMSMTMEDLERHIGKPGSWVTEELVTELKRSVERMVAHAHGQHSNP